MSIESQVELQGIMAAGHAVATALREMREYARPGMSTKELDEYGAKILKALGARSAPMKDYNFPGYTCISVNSEVCHGIPSSKRILQEGDLVNIDVSAELNGFYGDNGQSFVLGQDVNSLRPLVQSSREILDKAIANISHDIRISAIGHLIETEANKLGYTVIRNLCGHGIGRRLHEYPNEIPNFKDSGNSVRFKKDMVIAIETFISMGGSLAYELDDGWTMKSEGHEPVAQHEHTIIVTNGQPIIATKQLDYTA
ncbi:MAG: type I methionyl aminopeptidase [Bacteroidota bacterium]